MTLESTRSLETYLVVGRRERRDDGHFGSDWRARNRNRCGHDWTLALMFSTWGCVQTEIHAKARQARSEGVSEGRGENVSNAVQRRTLPRFPLLVVGALQGLRWIEHDSWTG